MRKKLFFYLLLLFIIFFIGFYPFFLTLEVVLPGSEKTILAIPVRDRDKFTIRFTHSVQKTPVDEVFSIRKDLKIVLEETIYSSYGAGLPSEIYGSQQFFLEKGTFIIRGFDREFDEIPIFVGEVVANHILLLSEKEFPLISFGLAGKSIRIRLQRYSLIFYILYLVSINGGR
jgi:hypothetical protein